MENTNTKTSFQNPLATEPINKLLKKFIVPAIISLIINAVYNLIDQIFLGQLIGPNANAATTIAFPVFISILAISVLFGVGAAINISTSLGENKRDYAEKTYEIMFLCVTILAILISIFGNIFIEPIVNLFGSTGETRAYSITYTSIILYGAWGNMMIVVLDKILRADNFPKVAMFGIVSGAVINTILDPILINIMGISGAAIATIISQYVSAFIMFFYLQKKGTLRINIKNLFNITKEHINSLKKTMYFGLSSFFIQISAILSQVILNRTLVKYSTLNTQYNSVVVLAAMGIIVKILIIITSVYVGIGIGFQPIIAFNNGAKNHSRVFETFRKSLIIATSFSIFSWLIIELFPSAIISLFDGSNGPFKEFGTHALRIYLGLSFFSGPQFIITMFFQSMGKPFISASLSLIRQVFLTIPFILILPIFGGLNGIIYSNPLSEIISFIISLTCIIIWYKNNKKVSDERI